MLVMKKQTWERVKHKEINGVVSTFVPQLIKHSWRENKGNHYSEENFHNGYKSRSDDVTKTKFLIQKEQDENCPLAKNQPVSVTWDQALLSFRFENYIPACKAKRKESLIQTFIFSYHKTIKQ